jgi:MFS family permease
VLTKILGIGELNEDSQKLCRYFVVLSIITSASLVFADGYMILYILDNLGYEKAGVLFAALFLIQGVIDFPTGVLGDWIGHKWVLVSAYFLFVFSYLLLGIKSTLDPSNQFNYFLIIIIIHGFALAQQSGALQTWFDNNYKKLAKDDDAENKLYGEIVGKIFVLNPILSFLVIIFGAYITDFWGREVLFIIQSVITIPLIITIFALMGRYEGNKQDLQLSNYKKLLIDGFLVITRSRYLFFLTITYLCLGVIISVWGYFFLFPIYFGYTGSDKWTNILRGIIFISGILSSLLATIVIKNFTPRKWIPRFILFFVLIWNSGYLIFLTLIPLPLNEVDASFNITAMFIVFVFAFILSFLSTAFFILFQKLMLELVPDENRNSYYSLLPTIGVLTAAVLFPFIGDLIKSTGKMNYVFAVFITLPSLVALFVIYIANWTDRSKVESKTITHSVMS